MKDFHIIEFGDDEPVTALYYDGKLLHYGDYYHDKISVYIDAFLEGAKFFAAKGFLTHKLRIPSEHCDGIDQGNPPPKSWPKPKLAKHAVID